MTTLTTQAPTIDNDLVTYPMHPYQLDVVVEVDDVRTTVRVFVRGLGLDREEAYAISLGANRRKAALLAERFTRYIKSGMAILRGVVLADINGKSYINLVWAQYPVGRRMNADLKKFGF